jgi:hypothetical protein
MMLAGCLLIFPVSAHPPSDMRISYYELTKDLKVTIIHPVPNPQGHYIQDVMVKINGKVVNDSRYTSQPAPDTFTYTYPIVTVPGDEIEVTASCVLTGSLSKTMYNTGLLPTTPSGMPADRSNQQAMEGLVPIFGAAAVFLIRKR